MASSHSERSSLFGPSSPSSSAGPSSLLLEKTPPSAPTSLRESLGLGQPPRTFGHASRNSIFDCAVAAPSGPFLGARRSSASAASLAPMAKTGLRPDSILAPSSPVEEAQPEARSALLAGDEDEDAILSKLPPTSLLRQMADNLNTSSGEGDSLDSPFEFTSSSGSASFPSSSDPSCSGSDSEEEESLADSDLFSIGGGSIVVGKEPAHRSRSGHAPRPALRRPNAPPRSIPSFTSCSMSCSTSSEQPSTTSSCATTPLDAPLCSPFAGAAVRFDLSAPGTILTWSASDYPDRRGDPPVQRLSYSEMKELRDVKNSLDLWRQEIASASMDDEDGSGSEDGSTPTVGGMYTSPARRETEERDTFPL